MKKIVKNERVGLEQYKKNKKKLPVILTGLIMVISLICVNLLQNYQAILAANSLDMIVAILFSIVVLGLFIMLPIFIEIKKYSK